MRAIGTALTVADPQHWALSDRRRRRDGGRAARTGQGGNPLAHGALDKGNDLRHDEMRHTTDCVIALPNNVLDAWRQNDVPRDMLDHANAVISLAYGTEFPLAGSISLALSRPAWRDRRL